MSLTVNALLDRLAECIYDVVCYASEHMEEDEKFSIALRTEFNDTVTKVPMEFRKSRNDHYDTVLLDCALARQQLEVVCDPKNYCYKDIREWIRSVIAGTIISGIVMTPELEETLKNADGQICICSLAGICHLIIRNHKDYVGNEWLKKNYIYRGFTVDPDAEDEYCLICGNYKMSSNDGHENLPVVPGIVPDDFGNQDIKYERFRVRKEDPYETYNVIDDPYDLND